MSQLITTSNISSIRPVFKDEPAENIKRYIQIKKIFEQTGEYKFFAEPLIAQGQKISWHTEYDGNIIAFAKLTDEEKKLNLSILKNQVNKIYKTILSYTDNPEQRQKLIELIDYCIEIPSYDDIYIIQNSNGQKNFCIVNWGFISDNFNAPTGLIAKLIPIKVADITIKVIKGNNKIVANEPININLYGNANQYTTNDQGKIFLNDIKLLEEILIYTLDNNNNVINAYNHIVIDDDEIIYNIEKDVRPKQEVMIQTIDDKDNILPRVNLRITYEDVDFIAETDNEGKFLIGELYVDTRVNCYQILNGKTIKSEEFTVKQGKQIYFLYFISENKNGPANIKIVNENNKPIPYATIQIITPDKKNINYFADENGNVNIDNIVYKEEIIVRQIINNTPQFQRILKFSPDKTSATFVGKDITPPHDYQTLIVTVLDKNNHPIPNLIVKLENGLKTNHHFTNDNGVVTFENINCQQPTKAIIEYKGKKVEKDIQCDKNKNEITIKLESGIKFKYFLWLLLLLLILGLLYLISKLDFSKIFSTKNETPVVVTDTVKKQEQEIGLLLYVVDTTNTPINDATIIIKYKDTNFVLKTNNKGQVRIKELVDTTQNVSIRVTAKKFQPVEQTFKIKPQKIIVLSNISREITESIYPCGTTIKSLGYRSTIKTFKMPSHRGIFGISYDMYQIPDQIIVYNGPVWEVNPTKIIWQSPKLEKGYHARNFNYDSKDSLITVEIKGGDTTTTEWYFKVWCEPLRIQNTRRDTL